MRKRKIRQGKQITSFDQLVSCDWVIVHGKPYHQGWVTSWQIGMAKAYLKRGVAYEGIRLTNGEYYEDLTDEQLIERFGEELHEKCPWNNGGNHSPGSLCEGSYCEEALENWKEELVE